MHVEELPADVIVQLTRFETQFQ